MSRRGLAGSSAIMFSGTLTSRVLGLVRNALLVAAIGATAGQADPFAVANTLPNIIYNLLAGGVLNAVLVPQVVRALQRRDSEDYVNRLLTMAGIGLFVITLIATAASALLVTLYASQMNPEWFNLAVAFAFWCIPQIFFYGIYTLLGQVLNAKESFGPYMWAPVANNIVAIIGLVIYLWIFGFARDGSGANPADWTAGRIALLAGFATLGVAVQAIVLAIALRRTGFRYRFKLGTAGLGGASRMALWSFAALAVGQIGFLAVTNVAAAANGAASELGAVLPANYTFDNAFLIYMLPQSLFTTSLITALFPRMSAKAAKGAHEEVSADFGLGLRVIATITIFMAVVLATLAVPISHVVLPSVTSEEARNVAAVLFPLALGIPFQGAWSLTQRVFFAYEDARTLFFYSIPMAIIQIAICFAGWKLLAPAQWVPMAAWSTTASMVVGFVLGYLGLMRIFPHFDHMRTAWTVLRLAIAGVVAGGVAILGQRLAPLPSDSGAGATFVHAVLLTAILGIFMTFTYGIVAHMLGVSDIAYLISRSVGLVKSVLGKLRPAPSPPQASSEEPAEPSASRDPLPTGPPQRRSVYLPPPPPPTLGWASDSDTSGMIPAVKVAWAPVKKAPNLSTPPSERGKDDIVAHNGKQQDNAGKDSVTKVAESALLAGRYRKVAPENIPPRPLGQWWQAYDEVLGENVSLFHCQQPDDAPALIDSARRAWLLHDERFAHITQVDAVDDGAIVVCDPFPQRSLAEAGTLAAGPAGAVVGEVAGALEAARRRGIHHLALSANHIRLNDQGAMIIVGLGVDGVNVTLPDHDDPVERALQASDRDAGSLQQLWEYLTGDPGTQALAEARNPGEIVEALAPWRPTDLEAAFEPLGIKLFAPEPKWKPVSQSPDSAPFSRDNTAAADDEDGLSGDSSQQRGDDHDGTLAPERSEADDSEVSDSEPASQATAAAESLAANDDEETERAESEAQPASPIGEADQVGDDDGAPTLPPPPSFFEPASSLGVQVPHSDRSEQRDGAETPALDDLDEAADEPHFSPQWQPKLLSHGGAPASFDDIFAPTETLPPRLPVHVSAVTGKTPHPLPLAVPGEPDATEQPPSSDADVADEAHETRFAPEDPRPAADLLDSAATPQSPSDDAPTGVEEQLETDGPQRELSDLDEAPGIAAAPAPSEVPLTFAPAPAEMPPSFAPSQPTAGEREQAQSGDEPDAQRAAEDVTPADRPDEAGANDATLPPPPSRDEHTPVDIAAESDQQSQPPAPLSRLDGEEPSPLEEAGEPAPPALNLPTPPSDEWQATPKWDDIVGPPAPAPDAPSPEQGEEFDEAEPVAELAEREASGLNALADSRAKPLAALEANYPDVAAAPLGGEVGEPDVAVLEPDSEEEATTRRQVLASRTDSATAAAITAAEKARIAAEKAREVSRRRADESMTRIEGLVERFDGFAAKHQLKLPGEVEEYDPSTPLSRRKIDPAPLIIGTFIVLTVIAMVLAVINLLPSRPRTATPVITNETTASAAPSQQPTQGSQPAPPAKAPAPEISNIDVLDPQGDGAENPELLSRAFDGDDETFWRSRSYVDPKYGMKNGIGLAIHLVAKTNVTGVTLQLHGEGGHVQVSTNAGDPPAGPILAEADMSATTELTFDATETDIIVLWFDTLPTAASDGKHRVELQGITLK